MKKLTQFVFVYFYMSGYSFKKAGIFTNTVAIFFLCGGIEAGAQEINITAGANLVMDGPVMLYVNNAAFKNNGSFLAGTGTVKFTGNADTAIAFVTGSSQNVFYNLSVDKNAYGVALKSIVNVRNILNVTAGNLYTDSNLTLLSDVSLTARVDIVPPGANIHGKTMVQRYIPARRAWRLMTAPLTDAASIYNTWQNKGLYTVGKGILVSGPGGGNGLDKASTSSLKTFNCATQALEVVTNTNTSISATNNGSADNTGYFVFIRGDRNVNNYISPNTNITTITATGKLQVGTQNFAASSIINGYTLVGNPFASPINFNAINRTNVLNRFYVWDPSLNTLGGYATIDDFDNNGVYTRSPMGSQQNVNIQSTQAFFVQTANNGTASLSITENAKSGVNNNGVFRPQSPLGIAGVTESIEINLYLLNADSSVTLADGVFTEYNDLYHDGVSQEDALKFTNISENIGLLRHGVILSLERRPLITQNDTLFLSLWKTTKRKYQLEFVASMVSNVGLQAFLMDGFLNTATPLDIGGVTKVNFFINGDAASSSVNRFKVVFKPLSTLPVLFTHVNAYLQGAQIVVDWSVSNEINVAKYEVEKSTNGKDFYLLHTVNANGIDNITGNYTLPDKDPAAGINYYRIKNIDHDGNSKYSPVVKVSIIKKAATVSVYPNPVKGNSIHLQLTDHPSGVYNIRLLNAAGQVVYKNELKVNRNHIYILNIGKNIPKGVYHLDISGGDNNIPVQKIIFQ